MRTAVHTSYLAPWATRSLVWTVLAFVIILYGACGNGSETAEEPAEDTLAAEVEEAPSIIEVLQQRERFTVLLDALARVGLTQTLDTSGPFTVFAPTDEAFAALPEGTLDSLDADALTNLLTYHITNGRMAATEVGGASTILMAQGSDVNVSVATDGVVRVNDATLSLVDIEAGNGVIHVIDAVLQPPAVAL